MYPQRLRQAFVCFLLPHLTTCLALRPAVAISMASARRLRIMALSLRMKHKRIQNRMLFRFFRKEKTRLLLVFNKEKTRFLRFFQEGKFGQRLHQNKKDSRVEFKDGRGDVSMNPMVSDDHVLYNRLY